MVRMNNFFQKIFYRAISEMPRYRDVAIMSFFTVFITLQPYWIGEINFFELGIYLPGIDVVLNGKIPYRDFFYLRGPLELYIPAFLMRFFGEHILVLNTYFYVGTVATLIIFIFIAKEIYKTKFVFYLMIPVFIGRTFPRVVYHIWGGMRYALGALAILFLIYFLRKRKLSLIFLAGIISSLAFLTSAEIGACSVFTVFVALSFLFYFKFETASFLKRSILFYLLGLATILLPYGIYLFSTQSFVPFIDSVYSVATNMTKIFPDYFYEPHPRNFIEALLGMNPLSDYFKHLTPAYCYLFFIFYMGIRSKRMPFQKTDFPIVIIFIYGFMMYILAFRKIGAAQFEMALQPEKLLLFFMLESIALFFIERKEKAKNLFTQKFSLAKRKKVLIQAWVINFLMLAFFMSSVCYAIKRYNDRFFMFQYVRNKILQKDVKRLLPLSNEQSKTLTIKRVRGMIAPAAQVENLEQVAKFISDKTAENEVIFMFPEYGAYSFILDRPFVGRFPMVTFSWMNDRWPDELMENLRTQKPRYAILPRTLDPTFEKAYFKVRQNKERFDEVMAYINKNYIIDEVCISSYIYKRKENN